MAESLKLANITATVSQPQCQFFVVRKKRLCRMTVRPGRQFCGEHEPQPETNDGKIDSRIPCPNDPKHTCYASKLEKHLAICNSRQGELPAYIILNINAPKDPDACPRRPLADVSPEQLSQVIDKINILYDKYLKDSIPLVPEQPIHSSVLEEFSEPQRTESSRRHLRQTSSLMHLVEQEGLVDDNTCYVELGAGKGQMSYHAWRAWCGRDGGDGGDGDGGAGSAVVAVDRAALRHKRDNALRQAAGASLRRLRADLAHLQLAAAPGLADARRLTGLAKHLCGVATDYALRCMVNASEHKRCGVVLATCCHHRCQQDTYVANSHLRELGITGEELNVMLGVVSWATCGDGRSRLERRHRDDVTPQSQSQRHRREQLGRRAKALLDWGRVLFLRGHGFQARLCYYVPTSVSLENMCIVANKYIT